MGLLRECPSLSTTSQHSNALTVSLKCAALKLSTPSLPRETSSPPPRTASTPRMEAPQLATRAQLHQVLTVQSRPAPSISVETKSLRLNPRVLFRRLTSSTT